MDRAQWTQRFQEFGLTKSMVEVAAAANPTNKPAASVERKVRPQKDQAAVNCPRCHSTNTKFCYYNNYSLTQPRYFCKTCRRYWTEGGTLRNVPVGGGSRKNNKKSSLMTSLTSSSIYSSSSSQKQPDLNPPINISHQFMISASHHHQDAGPSYKSHIDNDQGKDLNLGFPASAGLDHHHNYHHFGGNIIIPQFLEFPKAENRSGVTTSSAHHINPSSNTQLSALNFLRINEAAARGLQVNPSYMIPMGSTNLENNNALFASGFRLQESKPTHDNFSINDNGNITAHQNSYNGSLVSPSEAVKLPRLHSSDQNESNHEVKGSQDNISNIGYNWNGMLGDQGGSW